MTPIRIVRLSLCVAGTVLPLRHLLPWLAASGWDMGAMIDAWQASGPTRGLPADLSVAALTVIVWIVWDRGQRRERVGIVATPRIFLVGIPLALPLHLFLRSR